VIVGTFFFLSLDFININQVQSQTFYISKMSSLAKSFADTKLRVADHAKSMPDGVAKAEDYAIWGREFVKRLVRIVCGDEDILGY
jgi:hypothetical protein